MTSLNFLNILQSIIIFSGLVAGLVVCSKAGSHAALHVLLLLYFLGPTPMFCDTSLPFY